MKIYVLNSHPSYSATFGETETWCWLQVLRECINAHFVLRIIPRNTINRLKVPGVNRKAGTHQRELVRQLTCVSGGDPVSHSWPFPCLQEPFQVLFLQSQEILPPRGNRTQQTRYNNCTKEFHQPVTWQAWWLSSNQTVMIPNLKSRSADKGELHLAQTWQTAGHAHCGHELLLSSFLKQHLPAWAPPEVMRIARREQDKRGQSKLMETTRTVRLSEMAPNGSISWAGPTGRLMINTEDVWIKQISLLCKQRVKTSISRRISISISRSIL